MLGSRNNFADTEPQYTAKECKFLSLTQTFDMDLSRPEFHFEVPNQIELSDAMRRRLTLAQRSSDHTLSYPLPPSFSSKHHSYLQMLFIPWKERSTASVDYSIKATVTWHAKPGVGRLLGATRQKRWESSLSHMLKVVADVVLVQLPESSDSHSILDRRSEDDAPQVQQVER